MIFHDFIDAISAKELSQHRALVPSMLINNLHRENQVLKLITICATPTQPRESINLLNNHKLLHLLVVSGRRVEKCVTSSKQLRFRWERRCLSSSSTLSGRLLPLHFRFQARPISLTCWTLFAQRVRLLRNENVNNRTVCDCRRCFSTISRLRRLRLLWKLCNVAEPAE